MDRRSLVATVGAFTISGCLSDYSEQSNTGRLTPTENWTNETVADESFEGVATPICASGEDRNGTIESQPGSTITAHHFFHDEETGRYGVRGRIEYDGGGYMQTVRATFRDGDDDIASATWPFFQPTADAYRFVVATTEGDPDAVDSYVVYAPDGATAGPGPTVEDGTELVDSAWGRLGTAGGKPVYGSVATVRNASDARGEATVLVEASLADGTGVLNAQHSADLEPGETRKFYTPYRHCDPGAVTETSIRHVLVDR